MIERILKDILEATKYVFDQKGVSDHAMITAKIML